jgi:hypothetical protein
MKKRYVNIKAAPQNLNLEAVSQWANQYIRPNENCGHYTKDLYEHYCSHGTKKMPSGFFSRCLLEYCKKREEYKVSYGKKSLNGRTTGVIYNLELIETHELPGANSVF